MLNVFCNVIFRTAGYSYSILETINERYLQISNCLNNLSKLKSEKNIIQISVCNDIHEYIKSVVIESERRELLNLKRDIYNDRGLSKKIESVITILPIHIQEKYKHYLQSVRSINKVESEFNMYLQEAYDHEIKIIHRFCNNDSFKSGLLLSSKSLFEISTKHENWQKYFARDKNVLGFWKYVVRSVTKTTPFSTYTNVNIATLAKIDQPIHFYELTSTTRSYIKYNNYIFDSILTLIKCHSLFFLNLTVVNNPTIVEHGEYFEFITNNNNIEAFQKINRNSIIDFIIQTLKTTYCCTILELINSIRSATNEPYTSEIVSNYLFELIQTGLLQVEVSASMLDDSWVESLKVIINRYIGNLQPGKDILAQLDDLLEYQSQYTTSDSNQRNSLLVKIEKAFENILDILHETNDFNDKYLKIYNFSHIKNDVESPPDIFLHKLPAKHNRLNFRNIIYEDTAKDVVITLNDKLIKSLIQRLDSWMEAFSSLCVIDTEQSALYDFFVDNYKETSSLSLLQFYQDLYRNKPNYNTRNIDREIGESFKRFIRSQNGTTVNFGEGECNVSMDFLNKMTELLDKGVSNNKQNNHSVFMQLFCNDGRNMSGVISGGVLPGKGKLLGRFLHMFNDETTEELRLWNVSDICDNCIFVENSDASCFNANLHPRLLPFEIKLPGGNTRSEGGIVNVIDILVRPNHNLKRLELYNSNNQRLIVFDLGFETLMRRSNLYRLLSVFGENNGYPINIANQLFNDLYFGKNMKYNVTVYPRIVFDKQLVLQRKRWIIPHTAIIELQEVTKREGIAIVYQSVQRWKHDLQLPDLVFVRAHYNKNNNNHPISRDDYKPMFINFRSPLGVKAFTKLFGKIFNGQLIIEEMLPGPEDLLLINNGKFVNEVLVNWQST